MPCLWSCICHSNQRALDHRDVEKLNAIHVQVDGILCNVYFLIKEMTPTTKFFPQKTSISVYTFLPSYWSTSKETFTVDQFRKLAIIGNSFKLSQGCVFAKKSDKICDNRSLKCPKMQNERARNETVHDPYLKYMF